ncbi:hypothetical protein OAM01_01315 [bacterium]|nr:hypothetical protein [bacterium]
MKWKLNQPASIQDPKADVAKTVLTLLIERKPNDQSMHRGNVCIWQSVSRQHAW